MKRIFTPTLNRVSLPLRIWRNHIRARRSERRRLNHDRSLRAAGGEPVCWRSVDLREWRTLNARMFAISLMDRASCEGRRALFQRRAREYGWEVSFWPAVDGSAIEAFPDWVASTDRPSHPEPIGAGELGLLVTVRRLYAWALAEGLEHLVVFEDDAVIHAPPVLEVPEAYDFVFFNDLFFGDAAGELTYGWGNYAYVISRRGLAKMGEILDHVVEPIDLQIMMYCRSLGELGHYITQYRDRSLPQLECFHSGPLVTHAGYYESTIRKISGWD